MSSSIYFVLNTALGHFLESQKENNPQLMKDYYTMFDSARLDSLQAIEGISKTMLDIGISNDSECKEIKAEMLIKFALSLKNNVDILNLAIDGLEKVERCL
ncbi:hypothetical protein NYR60_01295 [Actinobacillus genomosp. 2]|uniref:hypothetical protein n=1 Tax=Actinobacillus genomosp. 2 TaxID=230709 RepID=UPI002442AA3F|nr:hypothetical protein [Actinobacillus genomosp. 2]WGE32281.1 hypothetical protein NYR60_01295 [Actinobacillus genomosp. 2]